VGFGHLALKFLDWALKKGQDQAKALDYVPLPDAVVMQIEQHWAKELPGAWKMASN
jgi:phosphate transport system substrate-binding protein